MHDAPLEARLASASPIAFTGLPRNVSSSLLADLDGDGRTDLLFNDHRDYCGGPQPTARSWVLWQDATGSLGPAVPLEGRNNCQLAADLDGDGGLDLVCSSERGWAVWWNGPAGLLAAPSTSLPVTAAVMATTAWDIDADGALDLVFANWQGASQVLHNRSARTFADVTADWNLDANGHAWTAAFVDFDGDGARELYIPADGAAHENRAFRDARAAGATEPRWERFRPTEEACDPVGFFATSNAAPMGVALGDINGDGSPELVLATGPSLNVLTRNPRPPHDWIDIERQLGMDRSTTTTGNFLVPWSPVLWDMDHDGALDLWVASGDDEGFAQGPNRGQSFMLVYRGQADGTFAEIADRIGTNRADQFCHVQLGDLDTDGDLDVVLGRFGQSALVLENRLATPTRHALVTLRGTVSNPHGLGATIVAASPRRAYPVGDHFPPWAAPQPVVDVALGADRSTDELQIHWPSGCEQVVRGPITTPTIVVTEPSWLTLAPAQRHHVAGSDATITVTVRPDLVGAAGTEVVIDDVANAGRWMGPTTPRADGSFERVLLAAERVGTVSLRVSVNGRVLPARPRLWFDAP